MTTQWQITMKPVFLHSVTTLAAKELHQVMAKVDMLVQDPLPDGKVKKQLTHLPGKPYRIRSGDYRGRPRKPPSFKILLANDVNG